MGVGASKRGGGASSRQPRRRAGRAAGTRAATHIKSLVARSGAIERVTVTIPSRPEEGRQVQTRILDSAERHGFDAHALFAIKLALEEALTNAIKHGNRLNPDKKVRVSASVSSKRLRVVIEDEGPGFERCCVPDPTADENLEKCSGRGILLMESYMTKVVWDRGGRRVTLVKEK